MGFTPWVGLAAMLQPLPQLNYRRTVEETERLRHHWAEHLPVLRPNQFPESSTMFEGPNCYAFAVGLTRYGFIRPGDLELRRREDSPVGVRGLQSDPRTWRALLELDGLRQWDPAGAIPQTGYPIALYLGSADRAPSFHFARPDRDGAWWHKIADYGPERLAGLPPRTLGGQLFQGMLWFDPEALNRGYVPLLTSRTERRLGLA